MRTTVLTLANGNFGPGELAPFGRAVEAVSGRRLQLRFVDGWAARRPGDPEIHVIDDVRAGRADLGWAVSRAFDVVGDRAFEPLHAPLLISSLAMT